MELTIKGEAKEIAALVVELQGRQDKVENVKEIHSAVSGGVTSALQAIRDTGGEQQG